MSDEARRAERGAAARRPPGGERDPVALDEQRRLALAAARMGTWQYDPASGAFSHDGICAELLVAPDGQRDLDLDDAFAALHPDDEPGVRRALERTVAEGVDYELTYRVVRPDGQVRWLLERVQPTLLADGEVARVDGVLMDVTEREDHARRVVDTLDSVTDGYLAFDAEWRITHINRSAEEQFGRSREELLGEVAWELYPELVGTDFERHYREAVETGRPQVFTAYYEPWRRWYEERAFPHDGGLVVFFLDVTERVEREAELAYAASHDELTGLPNRRECEQRLTAMLDDGEPVVLLLDLDDFKLVNDSLGHAVGDEVLVGLAERLHGRLPDAAVLCRFGGDEFIVIADGATVSEALELSARLRAVLREPFSLRGRTVGVSACVGVAPSDGARDAGTLIRNADAALFAAKRLGRGQAAVYDAGLHERALERLDLEQGLREALERGELELHYQPIFGLVDGRRRGAEALLRWRHPQRGLLAAGHFIDAAEGAGLTARIGAQVLEWACETIVASRSSAPLGTLWINVAPEELVSSEIVGAIAAARRRYRLRSGELGIELTERTLIRDPVTVRAQLERLHGLGVCVAIDDFGTGYSSMSALQHHRLDVIKIDRAFVSQLGEPKGRAIVGAVIELAHALGASASAEGVEEIEQWETLRALGCDTAAGYLLARPAPLEAGMPARVDLASTGPRR